MIIKVPKTIKVGGRQYAIVVRKEVDDGGDYGRVNHRTQAIELAPGRPPSEKVSTLIHEILHIINNVYNNRHCQEDDIHCLAEGFNQVVEGLGIELDWSLIGETDGSATENKDKEA